MRVECDVTGPPRRPRDSGRSDSASANRARACLVPDLRTSSSAWWRPGFAGSESGAFRPRSYDPRTESHQGFRTDTARRERRVRGARNAGRPRPGWRPSTASHVTSGTETGSPTICSCRPAIRRSARLSHASDRRGRLHPERSRRGLVENERVLRHVRVAQRRPLPSYHSPWPVMWSARSRCGLTPPGSESRRLCGLAPRQEAPRDRPGDAAGLPFHATVAWQRLSADLKAMSAARARR